MVEYGVNNLIFRGSSTAEQPTVNRLVVGSNPTRGAKLNEKRNLLLGQRVLSSYSKPFYLLG